MLNSYALNFRWKIEFIDHLININIVIPIEIAHILSFSILPKTTQTYQPWISVRYYFILWWIFYPFQ